MLKSSYCFVISFSLLAAFSTIDAALFEWTNNATSNNFSNVDNWNPAAVPGAEDDVVLIGAGNMSIQSTDRTLNSITITEAGARAVFVNAVAGGQTRTLTVQDLSTTSTAGSYLMRNNFSSSGVFGNLGVSVTNAFSIDSLISLGEASRDDERRAVGSFTVDGTSTIGSSGILRVIAVYNYNTAVANNLHLGSLVMQGGKIELGGGTGANGTPAGWDNIVTVNRLQSASATSEISVTRGGRTGAVVVNGTEDGVFDGILAEGLGELRLVKDGSSTLTLGGVNTYTGATRVLGGTLAIAAGGSIAASDEWFIGSGGTLSSVGNLALTASSVKIEIGSPGVAGKVVADGELTLAGDLVFTLGAIYGAASWDVFDFTGVSGDFASVTLMGSYSGALSLDGDVWAGTINGQDWTFSQLDGVLTVIPEPFTAGIIFGLSAVILLGVRRRGRA